jgi:DNA-binding transcriptional LysR family regulator
MTDWDEYRYFLAVADGGSLPEAARSLGVSLPTVTRRLGALEQRLGAKLFDRTPDGLRLTDAGSRLRERAGELRSDTRFIEQTVGGTPDAPAGRVIMATTVDIGTYCVTPGLAELSRRYPDIKVELVTSYEAVDLLGRRADLAIRIGARARDGLEYRRIGKLHFGLYAARSYADRHGLPRTIAELGHHRIIESTGETAHFPQVRWLRRNAPHAPVAFRCNNLLNQYAALVGGLGLFAMPRHMAAGRDDLVAVLENQFKVALDAWLVMRHDLTRSPKVSAVADFLFDHLRGSKLF